MQKAIYDDTKTKNRTKFVRSYYVEEDEIKKSLIYQKIIDYTELCFYQVPYKLKILPEEFLSEFLLSAMSQIDTILDSFRLSKLDFDPFLVNMIKNRAKYFYINKVHEEEKINTILRCDSIIHEPTVRYTCSANSPPPPLTDAHALKVQHLKKTDLRDICNEIISAPFIPRLYKDPHFNILHNYLNKSTHRRYLLQQILFTHNELDLDEIEYFALLFDVSPFLFDELDCCLQLWCKDKLQRIEDEKLKATKHWKRLILFDKTLHEPIGSEERQELLILKKRCIDMINKNSKNIYQRSKGIDSAQLADIFDTTQNRLLVFFCKQKKELANYLLQLNEKGTTGIIKTSLDSNEVCFDNLLCKWQ